MKPLELYSETVQLIGHKDELYTGKFSEDGLLFATAGADKTINIWNIFNDCENSSVLKGHSNAILDICFTKSNKLLSASADKSLALWDIYNGKRIKKFKDHKDVVNSVSCSMNEDTFISASEDCNFILWDLRTNKSFNKVNLKYQLTAVVLCDYLAFIGGIENKIYCYDIRNNSIQYTLEGHKDTITGLSISNGKDMLLSNSMDGQLITWDISTITTLNRRLNTFIGSYNNFEKNLIKCSWSCDDRYISCGSADKSINIWNSLSGELEKTLPGHIGSVNEVLFNKKFELLGSVSSDKTAILGKYK